MHPHAEHSHAGHSHTHSRDGQTHTHNGNVPQTVTFENVTVTYGPIHALNDVSFSVDSGSLSAVVGPNGGGKSTLLKAVVGLVKPDEGEVTVHGRPQR